MKISNQAKTVWEGSGKQGKGTFSTPSGVLNDAAISFKKRFEGEKGTNPEEIIAAAHSGCFSMALAVQLEQAGFTAERLETTAVVTLEKVGERLPRLEAAQSVDLTQVEPDLTAA